MKTRTLTPQECALVTMALVEAVPFFVNAANAMAEKDAESAQAMFGPFALLDMNEVADLATAFNGAQSVVMEIDETTLPPNTTAKTQVLWQKQEPSK